MLFQNFFIYILLTAGVGLSIVTRKLTNWAALVAGIIGLLVFKGGGYTGIIMLVLFFVSGTVSTNVGLKRKREIDATEENKGQRTTGQVLANGGMAGALGAFAWFLPAHAAVFQLMMAGSIAAATADTLSSELGTLLGRRFYNVITLKRDLPGLDGVVSIEGTLIGIAGAAGIAMVYAIGHHWNIGFLWIILAGMIGNLVDSLLGATLERRQLTGNNSVNFLNTLAGALVCLLLAIV